MTPRSGTARTAALLVAGFGMRHFSTADAEAAGVSRTRLIDAVAAGRVTRVRANTYRATPDPIDDTDVGELLRDLVDRAGRHGLAAGAGFETAARLWGLSSGESMPSVAGERAAPPAVVAVQHGSGLKFGRRPGLRVRRVMRLSPEHLLAGPNGIVITSPLRTAVDVARDTHQTLRPGLLIAGMRLRIAHLATSTCNAMSDYHEGDVTEWARDRQLRQAAFEELSALLRELVRTPRIGEVKRAMTHVEPLLESALEALSWVRFAETRLPLPAAQVWVTDAAGVARRVDFLWDDAGVIGEADGMIKYQGPEAIRAEKLRQEALEQTGRSVVRWTWDDMWSRPEATLARISAALSRRHPPWS